jgi:transposase
MQRTRYSLEFKKNAVKMSDEPQRTVIEVAEELGVNTRMLYNWRQIYLDKNEKSGGSFTNNSCLNDKQKIQELEQQLRHVESERDILKKAMMILGKNHF